ncbi:hypothetical protein HDU76_002751 [Blyttiomyces sp. JEL0837]|nr:hypothetical protein HDU76_002751 [Blyttiomyces sp. JEL0837]
MLFHTSTTEVYGSERVADLSVGFVGYNLNYEDYDEPPQIQYSEAMDNFAASNKSYVETPIQAVVNKSNGESITLHLINTSFQSYWSSKNNLLLSVAFLRIDASGTTFTETEYEPTFYGGSNIPPPDGPVLKELVIEWRSAYGAILAILSILGMLLCLLFLVLLILLRTTRVIKFMSPLFTAIYTLGIFIANLSLLFFIGPVSSSSCALRMWIPYLAAPLTFGCSLVKSARVYAIFRLSSRGKIKKGVIRFFKDDFVLFALGILVMIAVVLLSSWQNSFDHQAYIITSDRSTRLHACSEITTDTSTATFKIASIMIAYISVLLACTGFLSYLTGSMMDEGSFLSVSGMLGAVAFAVTLATTFAITPSETSIFVRNIVTWAVANLSLLGLYVPKLAESFADLNENDSAEYRGSIPSAALFTGTVSKVIHEPIKLQGSIHSLDQIESGREVSHINLRGAYYQKQLRSWGYWSKWSYGGITVFQNGEKKWIVFESEHASSTCQLHENSGINSLSERFLLLQLNDLNGQQIKLRMEFDDISRLREFMNSLTSFKSGQLML